MEHRQIANFERLKEELVRVAAESDRTGSPFGVLTVSVEEPIAPGRRRDSQAAEAILKASAGRLDRIRRPYDFVARCSGQSICVVVKNLASEKDLPAIKDRFRHALKSNPITVDGESYEVDPRLDTAVGIEGAEAVLREAERVLAQSAGQRTSSRR
jgi:GGDEF domain-containing protein